MSLKIIRLWIHPLFGLAVLFTLITLSTFSYAADSSDHERARLALESGEVQPLRAILENIEREYPGQVMEIELERESENKRASTYEENRNNAEWIYKIRLLRKGGLLIKLKVRARDGRILGIKERPNPAYRHREPH